ncbi:MAG: TIGR03668 family PPOX class F420-dependent oxidoreductase [Chloroflexi bacterium]|nr:TIGR03668 family PPOX class F420-dependent oxidoreductase [Chloroflexota bacterium]
MSTVLDPGQRALLDSARRATLATIASDGRPRLVPCCFTLLDGGDGPTIVTPIDEKPKRSSEPRTLARLGDIERDPRVTLLVDRWDEDWTRLAWLRIEGTARVVWPHHRPQDRPAAIELLRGRYPQYRAHHLESLPLVWVSVTSVRGWTAQSHD